MNLLVTRPETEARTTQRRLEAMGHHVLLAPLLRIAHETPPLHLNKVQALVVTSRNAVRALQVHPDWDRIAELPLFAVGGGTGEAARKAGFHTIAEGPAGGAELAELIAQSLDPNGGTLLHASGDVIAFDLAEVLLPLGFTVRRSIVYRSIASQELPEAVRVALREHSLDAVLLMSPRTSEIWVQLVRLADLETEARRLVHVCLSEAVAGPLRQLQGAVVQVAVQPNSEEMLALIAHLSSTSDQ